ncbi:hypothetical protein E1B28_008692 [Marasmius oreades]|uniref:Non-structural maintenance of chromosomes element 1 homolog n=1 Tax=Marasmius oreades TaxID=181124 RepID=A0A9P7S045_9AGAR|nr:uncharacterized protein E1B28_008692 [Marasmius oreades]KAG7092331.1 hypothetical protein E1B28_008692 [Marasmius oreades]
MVSVSIGDVQRLFLQAMLSRGVLSEKLAKAIWLQCINAVNIEDENIEIPYTNTEESWDTFLKNVNNTINDLDLEFKGIQDELTGKRLFSLVNRKDDETAQLATDFTPSEIIYFKAIVEQIMSARNESFSLSSMVALGEVTALKGKINMTKTQAENVLASFVAKGWLLRSKRGRYSLSPRTLLELYPYIRGTYADELLECTICHEVLTKGIACHTRNCTIRMHYHCFKAFRRRNGACPQCKVDWPREASDVPLVPVGEDALQDGEDSKRRVRARASTSSGDSDEDMEPSQTQSQSQSGPSRGQKSKKGNSSKIEADGEEDVDEPDDDGEGRPLRTQSKRHGGRH